MYRAGSMIYSKVSVLAAQAMNPKAMYNKKYLPILLLRDRYICDGVQVLSRARWRKAQVAKSSRFQRVESPESTQRLPLVTVTALLSPLPQTSLCIVYALAFMRARFRCFGKSRRCEIRNRKPQELQLGSVIQCHLYRYPRLCQTPCALSSASVVAPRLSFAA
jgi:hypothetical protein